MANFNYKNTCPIIDNALSNTEADIKALLNSFFEINEIKIEEILVTELISKIYSEIAPYNERVRETNSEMREAAERQITSIQNENEELEDKVNDLESKVNELEIEIQLLKSY